MDIIDIILAKSLTPQQLAFYISQAQAATQTATEAANNIEAITEQTNTNNTNAATALENVTAALNDLTTTADNEIDKLALATDKVNGQDSFDVHIDITYPSGKTAKLNSITKYYKDLGDNDDGTITQAALTALFTNLEQQIGSGGPNIGTENSGSMVKVGDDGKIDAASITEEELIQALVQTGHYQAKNAVGLEIDYVNGTYRRTQDAANDPDFLQKHSMFYGRMRCNVNDNGQITAWYGDNNYKEDGGNGQVMVYQPKFYYMRTPLSTTETSNGTVIKRESILLSETAQPGFKIHPLFVGNSNEELDYALLSAYEGSLYDNGAYDLIDSSTISAASKLSSIANAKPASGANKTFNIENANACAQARGAQWHVLSLEAISAQQMLMAVEFGTLNLQLALEAGITSITDNYGYNCASLTGSTSNLGNNTGFAEETINEIRGVTTVYTEAGKRAISYRGYENPWGNIWQMVSNIALVKMENTTNRKIMVNEQTEAGFYSSTSSTWISAFGAPTESLNYLFFPIECTGANSAIPVGDSFWAPAGTTQTSIVAIGGQWNHGQSAGPFYYSCDQVYSVSSRGLNARLIYVPYSKDTIHNQNVASWTAKLGG